MSLLFANWEESKQIFSPKTTGDKQRKEVKNSSVTSQKNAALHTPHSDPVTAHGISHINLWDSSMSRRIDSIVTLNCLDLGISTCRSRWVSYILHI